MNVKIFVSMGNVKVKVGLKINITVKMLVRMKDDVSVKVMMKVIVCIMKYGTYVTFFYHFCSHQTYFYLLQLFY